MRVRMCECMHMWVYGCMHVCVCVWINLSKHFESRGSIFCGFAWGGKRSTTNYKFKRKLQVSQHELKCGHES